MEKKSSLGLMGGICFVLLLAVPIGNLCAQGGKEPIKIGIDI